MVRTAPTIFAQSYWLFEELGRGGMGIVWLARRAHSYSSFTRPVALKRLHTHLARDPALRLMFLDEVSLASQVVHPNVASVVDFGDRDDELWCAMDYVDGIRLGDVTERIGTDPTYRPVLWRIFSDVALGLHAAHRATGDTGEPLDLVHRDVSPANILVGWDGFARICDFGIASARDRFQARTVEGFKGKIRFSSPEHLDGEPLGPESDVWSLGVVMWEALIGRRLFEGAHSGPVLNAVRSAEIPGARLMDATLPYAFDELVAKCLLRDRRRRLRSGAAVAQALSELTLIGERAVTSHDVARSLTDLFPEETERAAARRARIQRFLRQQDVTLSTEWHD